MPPSSSTTCPSRTDAAARRAIDAFATRARRARVANGVASPWRGSAPPWTRRRSPASSSSRRSRRIVSADTASSPERSAARTRPCVLSWSRITDRRSSVSTVATLHVYADLCTILRKHAARHAGGPPTPRRLPGGMGRKSTPPSRSAWSPARAALYASGRWKRSRQSESCSPGAPARRWRSMTATSTRRWGASCARSGSTGPGCSGDRAYLIDADGERYLDLISGYGVFALGRNHPDVISAVHELLAAEHRQPAAARGDAPERCPGRAAARPRSGRASPRWSRRTRVPRRSRRR